MHTSDQKHSNKYKCRSDQTNICGFCYHIRKHIVLYADLGSTVFPTSPAEFGMFIADETEKWGKVKFAGIKAN